MKSVLFTRKIDSKNKVLFEKNNIEVIHHDFVHISYIQSDGIFQKIKSNKSPFVFTSQHAVLAINEMSAQPQFDFKDLEAYCTEKKTKFIAERSGFKIKDSAKNSHFLANKIIKNKEEKVFYCTADWRLKKLENVVKEFGTEVQTCIVYKKEKQAIEIKTPAALAFFSPSQIDAYLMSNKLNVDAQVFSIGNTTANYAKKMGYKNILISPMANESDFSTFILKTLEPNAK